MAGVAPEVPRALAGRYRLVRLVARGGMAEVWEGRDEVLSRPVAVKILLSHLASDPFLRERFRREAVTAARLVHPGIVAIFDAGVEVLGEQGTGPGTVLSGHWSRDEHKQFELAWPEQPSTAFIIMELVQGETLRDLMSRSGPLAPELAVAITGQVTEALAYAHAQGLVHRDIKPANVLLGAEGHELVRVKVADFGIAKAAATAHVNLTASGALLGTPKYLSPEQVQGLEPDARADLYSLGVVLYEMLAGRAPFAGTTEMAIALAHVQDEPPALEGLRPGLPKPLYELVSALLVKNPAHRVPSALVLGGTLTSVRKALGMPAGDTGSYIKLRLSAAPAAGDAATSVDLAGPTEASTGKTVKANPPQVPAAISTDAALFGDAVTGTVSLGPPTEVGLTIPATSADRPGKGRRPAKKKRRNGRGASILVSLLLLAGCGVVYDLVHTGERVASADGPAGTSTSGNGGSVAPVQIMSVHELTQNGIKPDDFLNLLPDVINDKSPEWHSAVYKGPDFGNSGGFGLVLQLDGAHTLHSLEVVTPMVQWKAEVFVANADQPAESEWGAPVSSGSDLAYSHTFALDAKKGSWVLFWMIDPGPTEQAVVQHLILN